MAQELYAILDVMMALVGTAAEYLASNQRVLNLILVFSIIYLSLIAIAAYVRTRPDDGRMPRAAERRVGNGHRPSDPRLADGDPERAPALPIPATPPINPLNDAGHRLSRLEESYLQLNREVMHIDESTRDLRHELETLILRMDELRQEAMSTVPTPAPMEPVVGTALELVPLSARADLVATDDLNHFINTIEDTAKRVDELNSMVDAQRRTLVAIGQVLSQLPDWRKFKTSMADSLEHVVTAFESKPRKSG